MTNPYKELFAAPGTKGFALAGLLARVPLPMMGIGIIVMLSQLRGSYALAGAVSATFVVAYALLSPQISRLVDRYGQSRVLPAATAISVIGILLLLASAWSEAPDWTLFVGALSAGFMPSMSAMVRSRWTAIYRGHPRLQTAYSLETVLDEVTFIAGPPLSVGLSVMLFPQAGPLVAAVLLPIGVLALVAQRGTEPPVDGDVDSDRGVGADGGLDAHVDADVVVAGCATDRSGSAIRLGNVQLLALLMMAMGVIVGTIDIVSVAFAEQQGRPAAASLVLSAYAAGSCLAGLLFGALKLRTPLNRLLLLGGLATTATTLPLLLVENIFTLGAAVFVAGLFFAPTMIVAMSLVERLVPERQLTEGMTWLLAALNVGVALGAAVSGQVVDGASARGGFGVALCAGAVVSLLALLGHQCLRGQGAPLPRAA